VVCKINDDSHNRTCRSVVKLFKLRYVKEQHYCTFAALAFLDTIEEFTQGSSSEWLVLVSHAR
jgi:hypothetical protein